MPSHQLQLSSKEDGEYLPLAVRASLMLQQGYPVSNRLSRGHTGP